MTLNKIREMYEKEHDIKARLSGLRENLKSITQSDINTLNDAEMFIELLNTFRKTMADISELNGDNYVKTIKSLLAVGEDGLYSNNLRFLFELIQNVDDCEFSDSEERILDIRFDFDNDNTGKIILTYNELGFTPYNVFAITGIAEAAKNIEEGKVQIGEKGIGFKSVFGVADKVLIQSGLFSFYLDKENFTVPYSYYNPEFKEVSGTKMILEMPADKVREIYKTIKGQYLHIDSVFNRNPLLFLNRLTKLNFRSDVGNSICFSVSRSQYNNESDMFEKDVELSVNIMSDGKTDNQTIKCYRFTKSVVYNLDACKSRYGQDTKVAGENGKRMYVQAVLPVKEDLKKVTYGSFYSFLPTQIKLTVPIAVHVPFKLDASREFIDPQGRNSWFNKSCAFLNDLLYFMYVELSKEVEQHIVYYVPLVNENLFKPTNEKVWCLTSQKSFSGEAIAELKIFKITSGEMKRAKECKCINPKETKEPELINRLLGDNGALFISPSFERAKGIGIKSIESINGTLFLRALMNSDITKEALDYLSRQETYVITPSTMENVANNVFYNQLIPDQYCAIISNDKIYSEYKKVSINAVKKGSAPKFIAKSENYCDIREFLYADFTPEDTSDKMAAYLKRIKCRCILIDIEDKQFLAAGNAVLLSKNNPQTSFAAFCRNIDDKDLFSVNLDIQNASERLNILTKDKTISSEVYLKELRNIRNTVKVALRDNAYKNYVKLILNCGADEERFINELLQNADDCTYSEGIIPEFNLNYDDSKLITSYNETGFTKSNVRSITAIGESTKNGLLNNRQIGEKGIGFKTVFSMASSVEIHSGDFHFKLSEETPTIPGLINSKTGTEGTKMVFSLKKPLSSNVFSEERILKLCLCLRNLKMISIGKNKLSITDTDEVRTITVNDKSYQFKKYEYTFTVENDSLIAEREKSGRKIDKVQHIYCYIPSGKNEVSEYRLYCGLPTEIKTNIPLIIDAPFELTTSRDHVMHNEWSNMVAEHVYIALDNIIKDNCRDLRSKIFRFISLSSNIVRTNIGSTTVYSNNTFSDETLNINTWFYKVKSFRIMPTYNKEIFVLPSECKRYPAFVHYLLKKEELTSESPEHILDAPVTIYDSVLEGLGCVSAKTSDVLKIVGNTVNKYISDKDFRDKFYSYLRNSNNLEGSRELLRTMKIIPVHAKTAGLTEYVSWSKDKIFIKPGVIKSEESYYVLNENVLNKLDCEKIFGVTINEMNFTYEKGRYRDVFRAKIESFRRERNVIEEYYYILKEYSSGALRRYECLDIIKTYKQDNTLPLKNNAGDITTDSIHINTKPEGYFVSDFIDMITINKECLSMAKEAGCTELSRIHYDSFSYSDNLNGDDIEAIQDDYFLYSSELIQGFVDDELISSELIEFYNLNSLSEYNDVNVTDYDFPEDPVTDRQAITRHISKMWETPVNIIKEEVTRVVDKIQYNGKKSEINSGELRLKTMKRYSPDEGVCFCQMCLTPKSVNFIEVNNIQVKPKYYWAELRISLCLECSKKFEAMRANESFYRRFLEALKCADVFEDDSIEVEIANESITFTPTHLAEIQDILRMMPEE